MSRMKLPSGRQAQIGIFYAVENFGRRKNIHTTTIRVTLDGQVTLEGKSLCSLKDAFVKNEGRRVALIRLFKNDVRCMLNNTDRTALFPKICPRLFRNVKVQEK